MRSIEKIFARAPDTERGGDGIGGSVLRAGDAYLPAEEEVMFWMDRGPQEHPGITVQQANANAYISHMSIQTIEDLEKILSQADEQRHVLRVRFLQGEMYDLAEFSVAQDIGEDYPHCTAAFVRAIKSSEDKRSIFSEDVAMLFHLNDVTEVREPESNVLLFSCRAPV